MGFRAKIVGLLVDYRPASGAKIGYRIIVWGF
jgi:hypothetical protein